MLRFDELVEQVHQETGMTGDDLQVMVFLIASQIAANAGHQEALEHFRKRLDETLKRLGY